MAQFQRNSGSLCVEYAVWLAAGSKEGLNPDKWKVLKGRTVELYPDYGAFDKWKAKAKELPNVAKVTVSQFIEQLATEQGREMGFDLADYFLELDLKQYTRAEPEQATPHTHYHFAHPNEILSNQFIEDIKGLSGIYNLMINNQ